LKRSLAISVGTAIGSKATDRLSAETGGFPLFHGIQTGPEVHPVSYSICIGAFCPRLKASSAEVRNTGVTTPLLLCVHGVVVKGQRYLFFFSPDLKTAM
jgi:hypothetical protein